MKRDAIAPQKPLPDGLIQQLTARFGARFSMVPAVRDQHGRDESPYPVTPPDAVVFAQSTEEVQDLVKACAHYKVPIIAFGAGSSLEGHVLAFEGGVALDLTPMNQVLAVHQEDLMATVQAGVTRNQLSQEIRHTGLFFPIDPGEHGVGRHKIDLLQEELGAESVALMRQIKEAWDPDNIMNPGKVVQRDHQRH